MHITRGSTVSYYASRSKRYELWIQKGKGDIKVYQPPGQIGSLIAVIERSEARYTPTCKIAKIVDRSWISRKNNPANLERIDLDRNAEENSSFEREFPRENWPIDGASIAFESCRCDVERSWEGMKEGEERERERRDGRRSTSLQGWSTRFTRDGSIARPRVLDPPQTDSLCRRLDSMRRVLNVKRSPRSRNAANRIPPRSAKKKKRWYNVTGPRCVSDRTKASRKIFRHEFEKWCLKLLFIVRYLTEWSNFT